MADTLTAFEIPHQPLGLAVEYVNYKRHILGREPAFELAHEPALFASEFVHYRQNKATPSPTVEVGSETLLALDFLRQPPRVRILADATLVSVAVVPAVPGDDAVEIVFRIPNRLRLRPRLQAPLNGSLIRTGSVAMRWIPTSEAQYYEVHIALDDRFTQRVARFNTARFDIVRGLDFGRRYFWRVRAVAGTAWSDYSEVWSFYIPDLTPAPVATHEEDGGYLLLNQFRKGT